MTHCEVCNCELREGEEYFAFGTPYCETCFYEHHNYCSNCDEVISRDYCEFNDDGDPYCVDCWDSIGYDDDAPNNPEITDCDRELILKLSQSWVKRKKIDFTVISINDNDSFLSQIRDKVGVVKKRLYVYGLLNRPEYQLSASEDIIEKVTTFLKKKNEQIIVTETFGVRRLGVSQILRSESREEVIELIRYVTK